MRKAKSISECFAVLADTRTGPHTLHKLHDMLVIALCATICGADSYYDFELFGQCREEWLKKFLGLELPNGIPSHDTFNRVFSRSGPTHSDFKTRKRDRMVSGQWSVGSGQ